MSVTTTWRVEPFSGLFLWGYTLFSRLVLKWHCVSSTHFPSSTTTRRPCHWRIRETLALVVMQVRLLLWKPQRRCQAGRWNATLTVILSHLSLFFPFYPHSSSRLEGPLRAAPPLCLSRTCAAVDVCQLEAPGLMSLEDALGVVLGGDILHESNVFRPIRGQWALCFVGITISDFGVSS